MYILEVNHGSGEIHHYFLLPGESYTIGRKECRLLLPSNEPSISRHHATLVVSPVQRYAVFDAAANMEVCLQDFSKHGTFVDKERIGKDNSRFVYPEDRIRFGLRVTARIFPMLLSLTISPDMPAECLEEVVEVASKLGALVNEDAVTPPSEYYEKHVNCLGFLYVAPDKFTMDASMMQALGYGYTLVTTMYLSSLVKELKANDTMMPAEFPSPLPPAPASLGLRNVHYRRPVQTFYSVTEFLSVGSPASSTVFEGYTFLLLDEAIKECYVSILQEFKGNVVPVSVDNLSAWTEIGFDSSTVVVLAEKDFNEVSDIVLAQGGKCKDAKPLIKAYLELYKYCHCMVPEENLQLALYRDDAREINQKPDVCYLQRSREDAEREATMPASTSTTPEPAKEQPPGEKPHTSATTSALPERKKVQSSPIPPVPPSPRELSGPISPVVVPDTAAAPAAHATAEAPAAAAAAPAPAPAASKHSATSSPAAAAHVTPAVAPPAPAAAAVAPSVSASAPPLAPPPTVPRESSATTDNAPKRASTGAEKEGSPQIRRSTSAVEAERRTELSAEAKADARRRRPSLGVTPSPNRSLPREEPTSAKSRLPPKNRLGTVSAPVPARHMYSQELPLETPNNLSDYYGAQDKSPSPPSGRNVEEKRPVVVHAAAQVKNTSPNRMRVDAVKIDANGRRFSAPREPETVSKHQDPKAEGDEGASAAAAAAPRVKHQVVRRESVSCAPRTSSTSLARRAPGPTASNSSSSFQRQDSLKAREAATPHRLTTPRVSSSVPRNRPNTGGHPAAPTSSRHRTPPMQERQHSPVKPSYNSARRRRSGSSAQPLPPPGIPTTPGQIPGLRGGSNPSISGSVGEGAVVDSQLGKQCDEFMHSFLDTFMTDTEKSTRMVQRQTYVDSTSERFLEEGIQKLYDFLLQMYKTEQEIPPIYSTEGTRRSCHEVRQKATYILRKIKGTYDSVKVKPPPCLVRTRDAPSMRPTSPKKGYRVGSVADKRNSGTRD